MKGQSRILIIGGVATLGFMGIGLAVNAQHKNNIKKYIQGEIDSGTNASLQQSQALNPNYWKTSSDELLTVDQANTIAKQIYDDCNYLGSNFTDIAAAITGLANKAQVSQVAFYFNENYSQDLFTFLSKHATGDLLGAGSNAVGFAAIGSYINSLK